MLTQTFGTESTGHGISAVCRTHGRGEYFRTLLIVSWHPYMFKNGNYYDFHAKTGNKSDSNHTFFLVVWMLAELPPTPLGA